MPDSFTRRIAGTAVRTPSSGPAGPTTAGQNIAGQTTAGQTTAGQNTAGQTTASPTPPVLELRAVTKRFGDNTVLKDINLSVAPGEVFTLLGPSGCGKTTTLRIVAGFERPDEGELLLNGRMIVSSRQRTWVPPERRNMGMVFQSYAIWPHMTVRDNVAFPLQLRHVSRREITSRVLDTLELVGLGGLEKRQATQLSGGQQQRLALARALVYRPDVLLLDEPLSNLDAKMREAMRLELRRIQRETRATVLLVTHDQVEAMTLSDRVAIMDEGVVHQVGSPDEVYDRPNSPVVRDFLGRSVKLLGELSVDAGGAGRVRLAPPAEGTLAVTRASLDGHEPGPVVAAFRPDGLHLEPLVSSPAAGAGRLQVVIEDRLYLGDRHEYLVSCGESRFVVLTPAHQEYPVGTACTLVVDPDCVTLWAP